MKDGIERFKDDLAKVGRENPQLLIAKLEHVGLNRQELIVMKLRYVDGLYIKQIPEKLSVEERWAKKLHARAIIKTLDGLYEVDLVEMGIHHKATLRTLYQA